MTWAVVLEGRTDLSAVLLLLDDRPEAEFIVTEMRRRGQLVEVRYYLDGTTDGVGATATEGVRTPR